MAKFPKTDKLNVDYSEQKTLRFLIEGLLALGYSDGSINVNKSQFIFNK